jgi:hypothetical protein
MAGRGARARPGTLGPSGRRTGPRGSAPVATVPAAVGETHALLLFYETAGGPFALLFDVPGRQAQEDAARADEILARAAELAETGQERPVLPASTLPGLIDRAIGAATSRLAARQATFQAGVKPRGRSPSARLARRVFAALSTVPGGPDAELCRRSDRVLAWLAQPHDAGTEARLGAFLRDADTQPAGAVEPLIAAIEKLLDRARIEPTGGPRRHALDRPRLVAILEVRPEGNPSALRSSS